ncbi:DUF202 domain-containing protein [Microbacterium deminutum]|uniref:DUF202 domain-containing protein n=1 Tax=Microbacterium deminutum TaxID=344164 RepID=A0ABP5CIP8_9MICO
MALFDPGLQPERTELAWRRTVLALAVGSLVALRLLPAAFGSPWWVLAGVVGLIGAGGLWQWSRVRIRVVNEMLTRAGDRIALPGGMIMLALSAFVLAIALTGLLIVLAAARTAS